MLRKFVSDERLSGSCPLPRWVYLIQQRFYQGVPFHSILVVVPSHSILVVVPSHSILVVIPFHSILVVVPSHSILVVIPSHSILVVVPFHSILVVFPCIVRMVWFILKMIALQESFKYGLCMNDTSHGQQSFP